MRDALPRPDRRALIVGLGSPLRGDDGAGPEVARRLGGTQVADPASLLGLWEGRDTVVIVDAMRSGAPPGSVRRFDVVDAAVPAALRGAASTHAVGLAEAVELARVLGRLPRRTIVFAVEGAAFETGTGLSAAVEAAVPALVRAVAREAATA